MALPDYHLQGPLMELRTQSLVVWIASLAAHCRMSLNEDRLIPTLLLLLLHRRLHSQPLSQTVLLGHILLHQRRLNLPYLRYHRETLLQVGGHLQLRQYFRTLYLKFTKNLPRTPRLSQRLRPLQLLPPVLGNVAEVIRSLLATVI